MFSLERALIGFAAAVGDSVSRRPAMHVVGSLVAFDCSPSAFGRRWKATFSNCGYVLRREIYFVCVCVCVFDKYVFPSSRLVEYHHHHHHLCVCFSERNNAAGASSDQQRSEKRERQSARDVHFFFFRRPHFFFFADADARIVFWRDGGGTKTCVDGEGRNSDFDLPTTNFSLSLLCVCCLF